MAKFKVDKIYALTTREVDVVGTNIIRYWKQNPQMGNCFKVHYIDDEGDAYVKIDGAYCCVALQKSFDDGIVIKTFAAGRKYKAHNVQQISPTSAIRLYWAQNGITDTTFIVSKVDEYGNAYVKCTVNGVDTHMRAVNVTALIKGNVTRVKGKKNKKRNK